MVSLPQARIFLSRVTRGTRQCKAVAAIIRSGRSGTAGRAMPAIARLIDRVVLPTSPFWFKTKMIKKCPVPFRRAGRFPAFPASRKPHSRRHAFLLSCLGGNVKQFVNGHRDGKS